MLEINNAIRKAEERKQLIKNIVASEVRYFEWKNRLKEISVESEEAIRLNENIASDNSIISTWKSNFGITLEEIELVRDSVLDESIENTKIGFAEQRKDIELEIKRLQEEIEKIPENQKKSIDNIISLKKEKHIFK